MKRMTTDKINKQAETIEKALTLNTMSLEEKVKFLESPEWKELVEKARKTKLKSYTFIYRDTDGTTKESWHHITDENINYVKSKYKKQGKEVISVALREV